MSIEGKLYMIVLFIQFITIGRMIRGLKYTADDVGFAVLGCVCFDAGLLIFYKIYLWIV